MNYEIYFYNCSKEYINSISPILLSEVLDIISVLPKRTTQSEINRDLFWLLAAQKWSFDSTPVNLIDPPTDIKLDFITVQELRVCNDRNLCLTSSTLGANWHADFSKIFDGNLVQLEAQFGKVESMFKDFCGFKIARYERRIALGIEVVMCEPGKYFSHRKNSTSGMAYFNIAKQTLPAIGLDCPIWLIGIKE